jgi:hypothetical protein
MSPGALIRGLSAHRLRAITVVLTTLTAGLAWGVPAVQAAVGSEAGFAGSTSAAGLPMGPITSGLGDTCADDIGDSSVNGTRVVSARCDGNAEQDWTVETDGTIRINGLCLDVYQESKRNDAPIDLWPCTGRANQQWAALDGTLVNPVSGKCLDAPEHGRLPIWWWFRGEAKAHPAWDFGPPSSAQLVIFTCDGGRNQQWTLP